MFRDLVPLMQGHWCRVFDALVCLGFFGVGFRGF
jgi:hypothetical protein